MSTLLAQYTERFNLELKPLASVLESFLDELFGDKPFVCRLSTRPKAIDSFIAKSERNEDGIAKYSDPLNQIQDQLGALIIVHFLCHVDEAAAIVEKYFTHIERQSIEPDSETEFGYIGRHYVLFLPSDVTAKAGSDPEVSFFELQIKTLFQYAWSETNHVIGYKRMAELSSEQRRLSAYVAAQAWGADRAVDDLYAETTPANGNEVEDA